MVYDVTAPEASKFVLYKNTRDFTADIKGDSGPEGLHVILSKASPTGTPLLLVANESSGTVAVFEVVVE